MKKIVFLVTVVLSMLFTVPAFAAEDISEVADGCISSLFTNAVFAIADTDVYYTEDDASVVLCTILEGGSAELISLGDEYALVNVRSIGEGYVKVSDIETGRALFFTMQDIVVNEEAENELLRQEIVEYACSFIDVLPYVWGGSSLETGADCSGFTQAIFAEFGYDIPKYSQSQASVGIEVSEDELLPGDLIVYSPNSSGVGHVAIYIGDGKIVHCPCAGQKVSIKDDYDYRTILSIRRLVY